jgi:Co/Zn/Cd efflux system component
MNRHCHVQPHAHRFQSNRRRRLLAFVAQCSFFLVELAGGLLANSLALLAGALAWNAPPSNRRARGTIIPGSPL